MQYLSHVASGDLVMLTVLETERRWFRSVTRERTYQFTGANRWMDDGGRIVPATDPRHTRLLEIMTAKYSEQDLDKLIGL